MKLDYITQLLLTNDCLIIQANSSYLKELSAEIQEQPKLTLNSAYFTDVVPTNAGIIISTPWVQFSHFGKDIFILHDDSTIVPTYKTYKR